MQPFLKTGLGVGLLVLATAITAHVVEAPRAAPEGHGRRGLDPRASRGAGARAPGVTGQRLAGAPEQQAAASGVDGEATAAERRPAEDVDDEGDNGALRAVLEGDAWLASYWDFRNRPLMGADSRASYRALLSDPEMHEKVRRDLRDPEPTGPATQRNLQQLMEIDYLRDAIAWDDNPLREELLDLVAAMITEDNFVSGSDDDMRRTKAAVKRELYEMLVEVDAARAAAVVDDCRGTRLEGLVAFLADDAARRRRTTFDVERKPGGG
ncbi:hypothetical protein [Chondromyces apiculatus]|uniref:Uncharacterized protein n=1 Tax=Chondromyces apiculatus DSM 436 TaxID=1192034 RepID=A0A017SXM9_9BACT|nr:hypothetical protein [Chondromyces apiculatus]EYF01380.1 Hypothetical protein CAP_8311 [Chondromyces apiculatus DSM 436]